MKNLFLKLFFILFCFYSFTSKAQLPPMDSAYKLVFYDEFDSIYPTQVDTSKWARTPPWGSGSNLTGYLGYCLNTTDSFWDRAYIMGDVNDITILYVNNGICSLITNNIPILGTMDDWPVCDTATGMSVIGSHPCQNACIRNDSLYGDSLHHCHVIDTLSYRFRTGMLYSKEQFKYGYFEMRFRVPAALTPLANTGFGPNFWLYAADDSQNNWWSEIDIFEMNAHNLITSDSNRISSTVHYQGCSVDTLCHHAYGGGYGDLTGDTFYIAAAWWTPSFINFYLNDSLIHSVTRSDTIPVDSLIKMPIFIDINSPNAVACEHFDSANTHFPYIYEIDYVRVYQLKLECDTDKFYCNVTVGTFESKLYNSLTIGDTSCAATLAGGANITGLGVEYVLLQEGFSFDDTSNGYFNVLECEEGQFAGRYAAPPGTVHPPPLSWLKRFHYK